MLSGAEIQTVTPKIWQKFIGVTVKGKLIKDEVAKIAQDLYPTAVLHGKPYKRKGKVLQALINGRSDSLMIAHYGLNHT